MNDLTNTSNSVEISVEELTELIAFKHRFNALSGAGVDNWEGYDIAFEDFDPEEEAEQEVTHRLNSGL